jgi:hypothetical protein
VGAGQSWVPVSRGCRSVVGAGQSWVPVSLCKCRSDFVGAGQSYFEAVISIISESVTERSVGGGGVGGGGACGELR